MRCWLRWRHEQKTLSQRFDRCSVGGWEELAPLLPPDTKRGHPRTTDLREVVNGILYVLRGGIAWRMMPHDLPPWGTVWGTSATGATTAPGNGLRKHCGPGFGKSPGEKPPPARPSSDLTRIAASR